MQEVEGAKEVVQNRDHMALCKLKLFHWLENFLEISLHVLHYDEDKAHISIWRSDYIKYLGSELVVGHLRELSENLDLSYDFFGVVVVPKYSGDKLDSYLFSCGFWFSMDHLAVAPDAYELDELVVNEGVLPGGGKGGHFGGWALFEMGMFLRWYARSTFLMDIRVIVLFKVIF